METEAIGLEDMKAASSLNHRRQNQESDESAEKADLEKQCEAVETEWMLASEELDDLTTELPTG